MRPSSPRKRGPSAIECQNWIPLRGMTGVTDLPTRYARNMRLVGHTDQGGRPDGVQIMVHRGFAYVGHMFSKGFCVIDVRDPKNPRAVNYLAAPPNTWNIHLQTHDDLLLVINAKDMFAAAEFADEHAYYKGPLGKTVGTAEAKRTRDWTAGWRSTTSPSPTTPRQIGFMPRRRRRHPSHLVHRRALGLRLGAARRLHRLHLHHHRHERPDAAARGRALVDPGHEPGGRRDADLAEPTRRFGLHHAIIHGDTAYAAWRDAGMVVIDVADRAKPKLIVAPQLAPAVRRRHPQLPAAAGSRSAGRARRGRARSSGGRPQAHLGVRQPRADQPDQHLDLPDAGRSRLQSQGRPFRPAQHPREPAGQLRSARS